MHCFLYSYLPSSQRTTTELSILKSFSTQCTNALPQFYKIMVISVKPTPCYANKSLVLISIFIVACKYWAQNKTWKGKYLFGLSFHMAIHHQWNSGQELKQGSILEAGTDPEVSAAYWLTSTYFSASFAIESRNTNTGMTPPTISWALPN